MSPLRINAKEMLMIAEKTKSIDLVLEKYYRQAMELATRNCRLRKARLSPG